MAATIRISRHWSSDRMIETVLAQSAFGRGTQGVEQATQTWYGRPLGELVAEERLLLIALMQGPAYYYPVCVTGRFAKRYRSVATRAGIADPDATLARTRTHAVARAALPRIDPGTHDPVDSPQGHR